MVKRKVTLSIEEEVYEQFQKFCKDNDIMLSKRVERHMKREINDSSKLQTISGSKKLHEFLRGDKNGVG